MRIRPLGKKGTPMSRVLHVEMDSRYDLAMTFVRMQEWYESPKFHHKNFTLEQYMRWYATQSRGKGAFTYPIDWSGFNVPSEAVLAVLNHMDPPTEAEEKLFNRLMGMGLVIEPDPTRMGSKWDMYLASEPFYLIGTHSNGGKVDLRHEKAHGRFYVNPEYRQAMLDRVRAHNTKPLAKFLLDLGYSKWTLEDEIHAYALTGWPQGFSPNSEMKALQKSLRRCAVAYPAE